MKLMGSKTEKNLLRTFAGESRARTMYTLYGEKAEKEGLHYIAKVFKLTSDNELAHAREVFNDYLKMNGCTIENLLEAVAGEKAENEEIYKKFEDDAREEGFTEIADFYKEVREVEAEHAKRYEELAKKLENKTLYKSNTEIKWQCMNCGYIYIGTEAPERCPLCHYPQGYFKRFCEDYK